MRAAGRLGFLDFGVGLLAGFGEAFEVLRVGFGEAFGVLRVGFGKAFGVLRVGFGKAFGVLRAGGDVPFFFVAERVAAFFTIVRADARPPRGAAATCVVLRRDFCGDFWINVKSISSPT